ncbi:hypothetical protein ITOLOC_15780 [Lactiplantibacillus plantarum]|nr:hypothetical protein ITOLOC_15780 [Lactiplantibacillus plantarum]
MSAWVVAFGVTVAALAVVVMANGLAANGNAKASVATTDVNFFIWQIVKFKLNI